MFTAVAAVLAFAGAHPPVRAPLPSLLPPVPPAAPQASYEPLRQVINNYTATLPGTYSVYFKDLSSGQVLGINENAPVPDASCIKVPVVLYLYEQVAAGKLSWMDRVAYQQAVDYESGAGALQLTAENGNTFSLRCLATVAITISDNIAHNMLVRYLGSDNVMSFIKSIGGADTSRPYGSAATTAKDLGAFMEAVYRFAKQDPAQGRRLISDLGNSIFHVGLPGELPPDLLVAHKEGSISGVVNDMGIIFAKRPYILTVMSQGASDEDTGFHDIAEISRLVYDYQQQLPPQ
jgi:beta-lactamase class A